MSCAVPNEPKKCPNRPSGAKVRATALFLLNLIYPAIVDEIKQRNMVNSGVRGAKDKNLRSRCIGKLL